MRGSTSGATKNTKHGANASQPDGDDAAKELFFDDKGQFTGFDDQLDAMLVRQDLSQNKIPQTPKNQIQLVKMTDQLVKYLEEVCKSKGFADVLPTEEGRG